MTQDNIKLLYEETPEEDSKEELYKIIKNLYDQKAKLKKEYKELAKENQKLKNKNHELTKELFTLTIQNKL